MATSRWEAAFERCHALYKAFCLNSKDFKAGKITPSEAWKKIVESEYENHGYRHESISLGKLKSNVARLWAKSKKEKKLMEERSTLDSNPSPPRSIVRRITGSMKKAHQLQFAF